jgi:hypothetical protein
VRSNSVWQVVELRQERRHRLAPVADFGDCFKHRQCRIDEDAWVRHDCGMSSEKLVVWAPFVEDCLVVRENDLMSCG